MDAHAGNEELRAKLKALQYEVDDLKQEREMTAIKHEREVRDVSSSLEELYNKLQVVRVRSLAMVLTEDPGKSCPGPAEQARSGHLAIAGSQRFGHQRQTCA